MKVKKNSTPRVVCPEGTHIVILVGIIDYGTQTDKYGNRRKCELLFETAEETHVFNEERGEEPFIIDRKFSATIGKKSGLKECLEGLTGTKIEADEINIEDYLGIVGMISVVHAEDGEYTNLEIKSYSPLSKNDAKRKFKPHNELIVLDLDNFDQSVWDSGNALLPDWKKEKIEKTAEYKEAVANLKPAKATKPTAAPAPTKGKVTAAKGKAGDLFSRKK